jgi:rSAM/selenodomain-associated transferase 1
MIKNSVDELHSTQCDIALIIFIKNPELGKVKTRLAVTVGQQTALDVYLKLLDITCAVSKSVSAVRYLYYSTEIIESDIWENQLFEKRIQNGKDLGSRMSNAFEEILKFCNKAVIIGSDCPEMSSDIINSAFLALDRSDFVLGPSIDGGYYLIGMKQFEGSVFQNIAWSTDEVYSQTVLKINELGKTIYELPMLSDLDDFKDLNYLKSYFTKINV